MQAVAETTPPVIAGVQSAIDAACARIAPTWPLDRFIAVNPYWGHVERPIASAAAQLAGLSGSTMLMPRSWMRSQWQAGTIGRQHLQAAISAAGAPFSASALVDSLNREAAVPGRLQLATDVVDAHRDLSHAMAWRDYVTHHISQTCGAYFDQGQAAWGPEKQGGLFASWLRQSAHDFGPAMLMGYGGFTQRVAEFPSEPMAMIVFALRNLNVPAEALEAYMTALLMSINGWASWCAYQRWQARLEQRDDAQIIHLLAVRLAWELLLHEGNPALGVASKLSTVWRNSHGTIQQAKAAMEHDWIWQAALERSYQQPLCEGLRVARPTSHQPTPTAVQAVFCIDVRSEVYRRALEASSPAVQTMGFAGFFAMFVEYQPLGSHMVRPQLPGLLAPALCVTDECDSPSLGQVLAKRRTKNLLWRQQWQAFRGGAGSTFSFVESCGLLYAGKLLKQTFSSKATPTTVEQTGLPQKELGQLRPRFPATGGPDIDARVNSAATALGAMGLTKDYARLILMVGHGSTSANNPHAAGLDCGACGGQTGEVNARLLVQLLNDPAVRNGLHARGLMVPQDTRFLAGLHNTTTDEVQLFDTDLLPESHAADLASLEGWIKVAGQRARAERAASLGMAAIASEIAALSDAVKARTTDWAQVRPEWGLANCAAFIVAPRSRSQHLNLEGRSFLHDYQWDRDPGFGVLELIMTAPMVVTNWINMQYNASTVDNARYGSGSKLLHNVVGGNIGVFEGNGGDLRIGLPMQSLHDGENLRHTPLRLSVFIQAPQNPIDAIIGKHATVRHLLDNEWLTVFRLADDEGVWRYLPGGHWEQVSHE